MIVYMQSDADSSNAGVTVGECLGDSADNWYRTSR
jgi:hypothetical protein